MLSFKSIDLLALPFVFLFKTRRTVKTNIGATFFIFVIVSSLASLIYFSQPLINFSEYFVYNEISNDPTYQGMQLTPDNFIFAVAISKSGISYVLEQKFFTPILTLETQIRSDNGTFTRSSAPFTLTPCTQKDFARFPEDWNRLGGESSLLCPENLNVLLNGSFYQETFQYLSISLARCNNATNSSIVCAPKADSDEFMRDIRVDILFQDHSTQMHSSNNLFAPFLNQYSVAVDPYLYRKVDLFMKKSVVSTDTGLYFTPQISTESRLSYDTESSQIYSENAAYFVKVFMRISINKATYSKRYLRISDVVARANGILTASMLIAKLLAFFYSNFKIYEHLINTAFIYQTKKFEPPVPLSKDVSSNNESVPQAEVPHIDIDQFTINNYYRGNPEMEEGQGGNDCQKDRMMNSSMIMPSTDRRDHSVEDQLYSPHENHNLLHLSKIKPTFSEYHQAQVIENKETELKPTSPTIDPKNPPIMRLQTMGKARRIRKHVHSVIFASKLRRKHLDELIQEHLRVSRRRTTQENLEKKPTIRFNFWQTVFPFMFRKSKVFAEAKRTIDKYIDVEYIIEKIQEIDKLKRILLNRDEMLMMHFLPRPKIVHYQGVLEKFEVVDDSIDNYFRKITDEKVDEVIAAFERVQKRSLSGNFVSQQIMEIMDEEFKRSLGDWNISN
eukprot:TRINITY_DN3031_c0_g3_i11.p1 TRINITY_DN3031_c0_g3~~TRINITY_DN3031_c0_g3_i11.p1  ORF type:complete len:672 (-),score=109.89 TRINITY_DN3031_c0_g3_i11:819-2834(-)